MKRRLALLGAASAALFAMGGPAFAAPNDDLLSGFDGDAPLINNVSVLPVQMCGSGLAVGGLDFLVSQKTGSCTNAPVGDPVQTLITNSNNSKVVG